MKKIAFVLLTICLVISFSLVLSEAVLRLSGRVAVNGLHTAPEEIFYQIPGIFEPGQDFIYRVKPELPFHISVNSLGYRGPEIHRKKPQGTIRILCLGDSLTFGDFVDDNEAFPYQLQELFKQEVGKVEFINGGAGGSTIVDQFYFLKKSMAIEPDIVILTFFLNDIPDLNRPVPLYKSFEKNRKFKSSVVFAPVYRLFRDTALFQLALKAKASYKELFNQDKGVKGDKNPNLDTPDRDRLLLDKYAELFKDMKAYLDERSINFLFVLFPSHHQIGARTNSSDMQDYQIEWMERLAQRMDVPVVNLLEVFKGSHLGKNELYLLPYDGHPNKKAYALTANAISETLRKDFLGVVPRSDK